MSFRAYYLVPSSLSGSNCIQLILKIISHDWGIFKNLSLTPGNLETQTAFSDITEFPGSTKS